MSALPPVPSTELDAVNAILASVGEAPLATVDDTVVDGQIAHQLLLQVSRALQSVGWTWNTDLQVTLQLDVNGYANLSPQVVRVISPSFALVQRGQRLYDRVNQTFVLQATDTNGLKFDLVNMLGFDDMPEPARNYCMIKAGRLFQDRYNGENITHQFQSHDEISAWAALLNYEAENADWNYFYDNLDGYKMKLGRNTGMGYDARYR